MTAPIFSKELDARPDVAAWLASLDEKTRAELRDDVTPSFKEFTREALPERDREPEVEHTTRARPAGHAAKVKAALEGAAFARALRLEVERDRAAHGDDDTREAILTAAHRLLPPWRFRVFAAWFRGASRSQIARDLGVSRSTVRAALDGEGLKRAGPGALTTLVTSLRENETFKQAVLNMATKKKQQDERAERVLIWFQNIPRAKSELVVPLAFLLVLDDLADKNRQVKVQDTLAHFPRDLITPSLSMLKAHGYAASDGHVITIHRTPADVKESA